jgi:hypothetical protein
MFAQSVAILARGCASPAFVFESLLGSVLVTIRGAVLGSLPGSVPFTVWFCSSALQPYLCCRATSLHSPRQPWMGWCSCFRRRLRFSASDLRSGFARAAACPPHRRPRSGLRLAQLWCLGLPTASWRWSPWAASSCRERGLEPIKLPKLQTAYIVVQVVLCSYMCITAAHLAYLNNHTLWPCVSINALQPPMGSVL